MLESLFGALCKIGTLLKFSWNRSNSPNIKTNSTAKTGHAATTSGANSPIHIGDIHNNLPNPEVDSKLRFKNCLIAVANELPYNFCHRGNFRSPFLTIALEKLVHDETLVHSDSELFHKATHCLNTAQTLSTADPYHPKLKPANGQYLMKDLAEYISDKYGIKGPEQP